MPAFLISGPWHLRQWCEKMGRMSRSKRMSEGGGWFCGSEAGLAEAAHASTTMSAMLQRLSSNVFMNSRLVGKKLLRGQGGYTGSVRWVGGRSNHRKEI